ncbi:hypothetical protein Q5752_002954 [Cryptotrichosporon argae]
MRRPHLHLLIPSADPSIQLEARLYLPAAPGLPLATSASSSPTPHDAIEPTTRDALRAAGVTRLVTAAHPWALLGGSMLVPAIAQHVVGAALADPHTACLTYNARGVGRSGGAQPWFGLGTGAAPADFAAAEAAACALLGDGDSGGDVACLRLGYSHGALVAVLAPGSAAALLLVSPPLALFRLFSLFAHGFASAVRPHIRGSPAGASDGAADSASPGAGAGAGAGARPDRVWVVYGTADEFTARARYEAMRRTLGRGVAWVPIEGAAHFYVRPEDARALERAVGRWVESAASV